jgi:hypothetical protein
MAYEKKPGDLAVFKNDRKEKDSHPDYIITGLTLDGLPMKGALWLKEDRNGKKFMAGKIEVDEYVEGKQRGNETQSFRGGRDEGISGRDNYNQARQVMSPKSGAAFYDDDTSIPF